MDKEQWQAIKNRNSAYDSVFFCGLISHRVYCRVSCAAWARDIKRVTVFPTQEEAKQAGYRPCPHCRPDRPSWAGSKRELALAAQDYLKSHVTKKFSLETIAKALYVNGSYLSRTFKAETGRTLLWYHNHLRCEKAKELLTHNEYTIAAVGDLCGFVSSAHFSHVFKKMTGMTPSAYRLIQSEETAKDGE